MLKDNALTTVDALKRYLYKNNIDIQTPIFTIYNGAGDATAATYQIDDTSIVLIVTGGASAGTLTFSFTNAAYRTNSKLIAAINAAGKNWIAELSGNPEQETDQLAITVQTSALGLANKKTLYAPNILLIEELINSATAFIERYCGRRFKLTTYTEERYDGDGTHKIFLKNYPVVELISAKYYSVDAGYEDIDLDDIEIYAEEGYLYKTYPWRTGQRNVSLVYRAGFDLNVDGVPDDLEMICKDMVKLKLDTRDRSGIESERIGSYSVSYTTDEIPDDIEQKLIMWKRYEF